MNWRDHRAGELAPRAGMPVICRRYTFPDFASALAFTNRVGALAESKGHHPELITEWGGDGELVESQAQGAA